MDRMIEEINQLCKTNCLLKVMIGVLLSKQVVLPPSPPQTASQIRLPPSSRHSERSMNDIPFDRGNQVAIGRD